MPKTKSDSPENSKGRIKAWRAMEKMIDDGNLYTYEAIRTKEDSQVFAISNFFVEQRKTCCSN